jgi:hypothetical protein
VQVILLDENIEGFALYLRNLVASPEWIDFRDAVALQILDFQEAGLERGTSDRILWEFCQEHRYFLLTDNRNEDSADSLGATINSQNLETSMPVLTISDMNPFRTRMAITFFDYWRSCSSICSTQTRFSARVGSTFPKSIFFCSRTTPITP